MNFIPWAFAFIGHLGFWCVVYNRTHATNWSRKTRKFCEKLVIMAVLIPFCWFAIRVFGLGSYTIEALAGHSYIEWIYLFFSACIGVFFFLVWCSRKFERPPAALLSHEQRIYDVQKMVGRDLYLTPFAKALKKVPYNEAHCIAVEQLEFQIARLPQHLDGLRICHLSDFHFTGQIDIAYFEQVVKEANEFEPDLILITGDIIDDHDYLDWIDSIFGKLNSKHGTYFIRGNHDLRIGDQQMLLDRLQSTGMKWAGGGVWHSIEIDGARLQFAGNELPWHPGAEDLEANAADSQDTVKILLTHSPDQFEWARQFDFDLILAGHNHGGQIALPIVGPIVAPSKYGVRYAGGTFEIGDALMRVSRGLSGDECVRINCPPEVGLITLRAKR